MKTIEELPFQEVRQMREYALDLAAGYAKDARSHQSDSPEEAQKAVILEEEWIGYAKTLDEELQTRIKHTVQATKPVF